MSAARTGTALALLAAVAFGATAPMLSRLGAGSSPFTVATLLYAGAAAFAGAASLLSPQHGKEAPLRRAQLPRVFLVAVLGAGVAPVALAWGIVRTGATTGTLLLNLEAVFTVLLARFVYREPVGRRVAWALAAMLVGGMSLTVGTFGEAGVDARGVIAVGLATLAWAADSTLTRALADTRPLSVVGGKATMGACVTALVAAWTRARWPTIGASLGLIGCGALGYGASLVLYLRAQRLMGAGRTGSIFAVAPFIGAALASVVARTLPTPFMVLGAGLFGLGVYLHATERHAHRHRHAPLTHEHAHVHDDGHHEHVHEGTVTGEHSHVHSHVALEHEHDHAPDLHHEHDH